MSFVLIKGNPLESWLRLGSRFIVCGSYFSGLLGWWGISHIPSDHKQMCRRSSILFFHFLPSLTLLPKKYEGVKGFPDLYRFVTDHKHFTSFTLLSKGSCEKFHSSHVVFFQQNYWIPRYPAKIQVGNNIWNTSLKKCMNFIRLFHWMAPSPPITAVFSLLAFLNRALMERELVPRWVWEHAEHPEQPKQNQWNIWFRAGQRVSLQGMDACGAVTPLILLAEVCRCSTVSLGAPGAQWGWMDGYKALFSSLLLLCSTNPAIS